MELKYKVKGVELNETDLASICEYYESALIARTVLGNYPQVSEERAMDIGTEARRQMIKFDLDEDEAIDAALEVYPIVSAGFVGLLELKAKALGWTLDVDDDGAAQLTTADPTGETFYVDLEGEDYVRELREFADEYDPEDDDYMPLEAANEMKARLEKLAEAFEAPESEVG